MNHKNFGEKTHPVNAPLQASSQVQMPRIFIASLVLHFFPLVAN